ncbi:MAG: Holliday junction branch migration protein RuvA [Flavobacteriia bacterium]|nr:Holliday junction branch migration protein RuvA [Flavobacteriia bacterium]
MIGSLNGRLIEKNPTELLVECSGVGYEVKISLNTYTQLNDSEQIKLHTKLIVREDAQILYGFFTKEEREMFNYLISVSGIGPNTAMIMLSSLIPEEIAHAIQTDDVVTIQGIKGIGAKTAQRVIIDLKGKVIKFSFGSETFVLKGNKTRFDALNALVSLGFDKKSTEKVLEKIDNGEQTVEQLIKEALRLL